MAAADDTCPVLALATSSLSEQSSDSSESVTRADAPPGADAFRVCKRLGIVWSIIHKYEAAGMSLEKLQVKDLLMACCPNVSKRRWETEASKARQVLKQTLYPDGLNEGLKDELADDGCLYI